jgi:hypothetical protein
LMSSPQWRRIGLPIVKDKCCDLTISMAEDM